MMDYIRNMHSIDLQFNLCYTIFIFALINSVDAPTIGFYVQWVAGLDSLRLATGLTSIIRVLIVHAEGKTMLMNAGFFSYIMTQTNYTAWIRSVSPFFKPDISDESSDSLGKSDMDLISEASQFSHRHFILMKRYYAFLFVLTVLVYWHHVYKCS